jgi:hypothetical protein
MPVGLVLAVGLDFICFSETGMCVVYVLYSKSYVLCPYLCPYTSIPGTPHPYQSKLCRGLVETCSINPNTATRTQLPFEEWKLLLR